MSRLEIYWSFRSPYSYLAVDRLRGMIDKFDLDTKFRPVRPLALREPGFFKRGRKQFVPYLLKDVAREAERLQIAFGPPDPDPIIMNMETGEVAPDQPHMDRIMALALAACARGRGLDFAAVVGRSIWGGAPRWIGDDVLAKTLADADFDIEALSEWAAENEGEIAAIIARNEEAQLEHHWGVPLMVLDGEPFFGQDRLDALRWRLQRRG